MKGKERYVTPEMEVEKLRSIDVITASPGGDPIDVEDGVDW